MDKKLKKAKKLFDQISDNYDGYLEHVNLLKNMIDNNISDDDFTLFDKIERLSKILLNTIIDLDSELDKIDTDNISDEDELKFDKFIDKYHDTLEDIIQAHENQKALEMIYYRNQVRELKSNVKRSENKFLNQVITIMGVFISIFSLIIPNIAIFSSDTNITVKSILVINGTSLASIITLMIIIGFLTEKKVGRFVYLYLPATALIASSFLHEKIIELIS